jgi:integrase
VVYKLPEIITEEQLIKILKKTKHKHHRIAYALGFYQCMRISEVVNLKKEDIDKSLKLIKIKRGKGEKDRNIPINPKIMGGLKNIPIKIGVRALQKAFKKKAEEVLKRKDIYFHILRHSGVTYYLTKKKWNTLEVQRLAGHSRSSTTEIYTHITPEDLVNRMWEEE